MIQEKTNKKKNQILYLEMLVNKTTKGSNSNIIIEI